MTIIEILRLLIPFKTHDTTASHLRRQLEDVDLEAMIATKARLSSPTSSHHR
jgi:hypothetical protein